MMTHISKMQDIKKPSIFYAKNGNAYSNTIYTFDIETTSLFLINGKWKMFDKSIPQKSDITTIGYDKIKKAGCCYHCQMSIENKVYYFREISQFEEVLKKLSNPMLTKIFFVHNLCFEIEWLLPILKKYTITNMVAREARKPISFHIEELNIDFRCSMMLTNLSLAKSAEKYTSVQKAVGDLDYNILRSPLTKLTEKEQYYCEMDCVTLYEIIKYFRKVYGSVKNIPLTQTGEMRRAYREIVPPYHYKYVRSLVPDLFEYKSLNRSFQGGITHGNCIHVKDVIKEEMTSMDIASSYPLVMVSELYPCERFRKIDNDCVKYYETERYARIYYVEFYNIVANMYNHYIPFSKCIKTKGEVLDNGRLVSADYVFMCITDVDLDIIKLSYNINEIKYVDVMVAKRDYLPKYFIEFILDLYGSKTTLKNVKGAEEFYAKSKQILNSSYGASVMNLIQSSVLLIDGKWVSANTNDDKFLNEKLEEQEESFNLFVYSTGCYVTAWARKNLFMRMIDNNYELDYDTVYYDTDSLKIMNFEKHKKIFDDYNKIVDRKLMKMCLHYGINYERTRPKDNKGIEHPIGHFETDGVYTEFVTLGAKRYCYRDKSDGKLHMTVSGVSKAGVTVLNDDIRNFNDTLFFDYENAHKSISCYNDEQEQFTFIDCDGNEYTNTWGSAIVIYPTTYSMSLNPDFDDFVKFISRKMNSEISTDFVNEYKRHNKQSLR